MNDHCANTYDVIRTKNDETKAAFIKNVISKTGIPVNFKPLPRSYENKIFFRVKDGEHQQREYILFENNQFFCVYCLCFSLLENHRLVRGIKYEQNCRISYILNSHEDEAHHNRAKNIYLRIVSNCDRQDNINQLEKRNVIKAIVKIIIFIATHGQY